MAVIESGLEICIAVVRQIEQRRQDGCNPRKILMSQRQCDALDRWSVRVSGLPYHEALMPQERTMYDLPIIICPDCDLYVVPD